jgi:acetyl-CoA decarbonylase/synthase complex subunit beta
VLVLGGEDQHELISKLKQLDFMVFTDLGSIPKTIYIGNRPISPVYFLQLMVRYGLVWGKIAPGDDHEMGHFLEKDMPGFIIICQDLPPLKYLITLGLMKLGAPAIVPSSFPFPYGYRLVADNTADILKSIANIPNLRQRYFEDEIIRLPVPYNLAFVNEKINISRTYGGGPDSFFCVRPAELVGPRTQILGHPSGPMAIQVNIAAEHFCDDIALSAERMALRAVNTIPGVHAHLSNDIFSLEVGSGVELDEHLVGEAIYCGIRLVYPRIKDIGIDIIFDPEILAEQAMQVQEYKNKRRQRVNAMTEANTEDFCACIECRPFSLVHTCIITPEHPPMCGSRTYGSVKAGAYFGSDQIPWKRPSEKELPMRSVFKKGQLLDKERGEYEGNQVYRDLTRGQLQRVFLHSTRDYPLTSCGCFQALAFWIPEAEGIGIISRNSSAITPDGHNWEELANHAGGKQTPGIVGVSYQYMHSPQFLRGDGGMANVVWVDSALHQKIGNLFIPNQKVASEKTARTIRELLTYIKR